MSKADGYESLSYREMLPSDLPAVMINENAAYTIPWPEKVMAECIEGRNQCWVLQQGSRIVGHAIISIVLDETHLLNICIHPRHSRQGLGRYFLNQFIDAANQRGDCAFFLEVRKSNVAAQELYRSSGFNEVGVRKNYYPNGDTKEDAILMTLQLKEEWDWGKH